MPNPKSKSAHISSLIQSLRDDLLSGAAEIALRAISIFQIVITQNEGQSVDDLKQQLTEVALALINAQPAMAPLFHLTNSVLFATNEANTVSEIQQHCQNALNRFEQTLCDSAAKIAEITYDLIPPGELIFAYSFSSTVISCLLNARAKGKFFRVVCTEARPSLEGRKLAARLAAGGIEVIHTFDSAMGIVLPNCTTAFMGCDCVGLPGVVNKIGSWALAVSCKELSIPLYALSGTEKFVTDERLFEFEKHERPGEEVWDAAPKGVRVLNHQFELVPFSLMAGLVTEFGILKEKDIAQHISKLEVHKALKLEGTSVV
jgi:translation initiation factor 2B subunit (eIF-2B alpha/beta/delta family)